MWLFLGSVLEDSVTYTTTMKIEKLNILNMSYIYYMHNYKMLNTIWPIAEGYIRRLFFIMSV